MAANSNIQITALDFADIKNNLKKFLQSQDTLKDYNFEGSALSVLLDVLAYNTQYNAYYLNMVANEMFLDTAQMRTSVVSHAKLLDYTPKSAIAPTATVNIVVHGVTSSTLTLPKQTKFVSEAINGTNYQFVTSDSYTVDVSNGVATFQDVQIKQGQAINKRFTVNSTENPNYLFALPDTGIDTTSMLVYVQQSSSNTSYQIYNPASDFLTLNANSYVYFLQESISTPGTYEIYFGDGVLGYKLPDGSVVNVSYIKTQGTAASGANNFTLMDTVSGFANTVVYPVYAATQGGNIESISSIKYQAPKSYAAQGRAVTKEDYITLIQQNQLGYSFDSVNVWGGQENTPPVYGQVFICIKPSGSLLLTEVQKQQILTEIIQPISVLTVKPTIVDPDYTFVQITTNVYYDPKRTNLTGSQIQTSVTNAIQTFGNNTLNTFNSIFSLSDLILAIKNSDTSIIANEVTVNLQKKFYPSLTETETYNLYFGTPLEKGIFLSGISSSPALTFIDPNNPNNTISGVFIEELPTNIGGVKSISIVNPGYGYQSPPTVTIYGDGSGATAQAFINASGQISAINILTPGSNYTTASVVITPQANDTTGQLALAVPVLTGSTGVLQTYYFNMNNVKTILNANAGTVDYENGIVTLNGFNPIGINNIFGELTITAKPVSTIISSTYNRLISIDPMDPNAITVNVMVQ